MHYTITIYKRPGIYSNHPLYAVWVDASDADPQPGIMWEVVQQVTVKAKQPIPKALCGQLLMTEATSDDLFRDIYDTWVGPIDHDPLNNYVVLTTEEHMQKTSDRSHFGKLKGV